jgi:hypothetical protein
VQIIGAPAGVITVIAVLLGVLGMAGEYRHHTITTTFLATPRRRDVVIAKIIAHALIGAVMGLLALTVSAAIAVPWLLSSGIDVPLNGDLVLVAAGLIVSTALYGALYITLLVVAAASCSGNSADESFASREEEPIAYIGHGAFFDRTGRQIVPTEAWVERAQQWYRDRLVARVEPNGKEEFETFERRLQRASDVQGQARLVVRQRSLDWLLARMPRTVENLRMQAKVNLIGSQLRWQLPRNAQDLERMRNLGEYYASPVWADGKVFVAAKNGFVLVLSDGPKLEVLARNDMGGEILATPAIAGGRLFIRTREKLYCIGAAAR